ncbi:MAG: acyl-CoA dehydrogenase [Tsuneonella sp.]
MDLHPSEQQELLRQSLDGYLARHLPFERRAAQSAGDMLAFWSALNGELGIGGAGAGEELGGFGGGAEEEMIVGAALGRALAVTPYVEGVVLAADLLARIGCADLAGLLVRGEAIAAVAIEEPQTRGTIAFTATVAERVSGGWTISGRKIAVSFASQASILLVPARIGDDFALFALEPAQSAPAIRAYALIDGTPAADLHLDRIKLPDVALLARGAQVRVALEAAIDRATTALCAEASGVAEVMLADTVVYAKERTQFGQPLAAFQALQHRMVDMFIASEQLSAAALLAALKVNDPMAVSAAKATAGDCLKLIGQEAVQLHGAMGLSEELRVGHYFKRATVLQARLGTTDRHVDCYRERRLAAPG